MRSGSTNSRRLGRISSMLHERIGPCRSSKAALTFKTFKGVEVAKSDSNRDRIGKMFELLAPALDEFITDAVEAELDDGITWPQLVALKDKRKKGQIHDEYDRLDPQVQLRML